MFKFLNSFKAAMLLGKGHKYLQNGRYGDALAKAQKAKKLKLETQFAWLCYSIEGKSRYHLGDKENALISLRRAEEILAPMLLEENASKHLSNIMSDVTNYITRIEHGGR